MTHQEYMQIAIELSKENIANGGGPFGAVIIKDGKIIGKGVNRVTANNDPTAHAEVQAIRDACEQLSSFDLAGATIYSSCEPCPMCLGAIYWSGITALYFGNNQQDAENIGFSDKFIYEEIARPYGQRKLTTISMMKAEAIEAFKMWENKTDKICY